MTRSSICLCMVMAFALLVGADDRTVTAPYPSSHTTPRELIQKCPACDTEIHIRRTESGELKVACDACRQDMKVKSLNGRHTTFECPGCPHRIELTRLKDHRMSVHCPNCNQEMVLNCPECVEGKLKYARFTSRGATMSCNGCHGEGTIRD